jgi:hypothetical protein
MPLRLIRWRGAGWWTPGEDVIRTLGSRAGCGAAPERSGRDRPSDEGPPKARDVAGVAPRSRSPVSPQANRAQVGVAAPPPPRPLARFLASVVQQTSPARTSGEAAPPNVASARPVCCRWCNKRALRVRRARQRRPMSRPLAQFVAGRATNGPCAYVGRGSAAQCRVRSPSLLPVVQQTALRACPPARPRRPGAPACPGGLAVMLAHSLGHGPVRWFHGLVEPAMDRAHDVPVGGSPVWVSAIRAATRGSPGHLVADCGRSRTVTARVGGGE